MSLPEERKTEFQRDPKGTSSHRTDRSEALTENKKCAREVNLAVTSTKEFKKNSTVSIWKEEGGDQLIQKNKIDDRQRMQ